jgi:hypothetical protein
MILTVDSVGGTRRFDSFHPAIRLASRVVSYLFHPLFIPVYVGWFLLYEARLFPEKTHEQRTLILIQFFFYYSFLPLFVTLLCKGLGFIGSVQLKNQRDRIIPYVLCEIFYFWGWYVFRNLGYAKESIFFALGIFLACSLGLILNAYLKISMHAISVGVLCAFLLLAALRSEVNYGPYIAIGFLIAGLTCTARLIDSSHTTAEIYAGFFAGALAEAVAYLFV